MADELKDQRVVTMMSPSEVKSIDDWMFANRIRSRGEAIRRLTTFALLIVEDMPSISNSFSKAGERFGELLFELNRKLIDLELPEEKLEDITHLLHDLVDAHYASAQLEASILDMVHALQASEPFEEVREEAREGLKLAQSSLRRWLKTGIWPIDARSENYQDESE